LYWDDEGNHHNVLLGGRIAGLAGSWSRSFVTFSGWEADMVGREVAGVTAAVQIYTGTGTGRRCGPRQYERGTKDAHEDSTKGMEVFAGES